MEQVALNRREATLSVKSGASTSKLMERAALNRRKAMLSIAV